jgi:HrpA-like RNA helicase
VRFCGDAGPHDAQDTGDILIFLPGQDHIDTAIEQLSEESRNISRRHEMRLVPMALYSALPPAEQLRVFEPLPKGHRKVSPSRLAL